MGAETCICEYEYGCASCMHGCEFEVDIGCLSVLNLVLFSK